MTTKKPHELEIGDVIEGGWTVTTQPKHIHPGYTMVKAYPPSGKSMERELCWDHTEQDTDIPLILTSEDKWA